MGPSRPAATPRLHAPPPSSSPFRPTTLNQKQIQTQNLHSLNPVMNCMYTSFSTSRQTDTFSCYHSSLVQDLGMDRQERAENSTKPGRKRSWTWRRLSKGVAKGERSG
eukprot:GFKZ01000117.1.p1 GENE.GFKZ01000117.1~~GFKZ01000117.1.p1  ORF type:complete len:108 (+),score=9.62 GFKZ01000117.1:130-453(+)